MAKRSFVVSICWFFLSWTVLSQQTEEFISRQVLLSVVDQSFKLGYDIYAGAEFSFSVLTKGTAEQGVGDGCDLPHNVFEKLSVDVAVLGAQVKKTEQSTECKTLAAGQYTVTVPLGRVCDCADKLIELKALLKSFSSQEYTVALMPFVRHGAMGNGLHMAWYLFDILEQKNMCELMGEAEESPLRVQQSIAGILSVLRDMSVILNPTINSYKRLKCGVTAGKMIAGWSRGGSCAALNLVKNWADSGQNALVVTTADMGVDPYLAYAAISRAALEGIQYGMEAPQAYDSTCEPMGKIHQLPTSLAQAIQIAETSDFLRDWLGETLENYLTEKRKELAEYEQTVTDWEIKKYA